MPLDPFAHPFRERHGRVEHGARKQQHELLATVAADPIDLARFVFQNGGQLLEHLVTGLVAVRVVDALEVVEIAHHARERLVQP